MTALPTYTPDEVRALLRTDRCPLCGSDDISAWGATGERTDADITDHVGCNACKAEGDVPRPTLGIPYASAEIEPDGSVVRVCPVCGLRIPEPTDDVGEALANPYGEHYVAEHEGDEGAKS